MPRKRPPSFADIVRQVKAEPSIARKVRPGVDRWERFTHRDGRIFALVARQITPPDALAAAAGGAEVVGDVCSCGGYCGLDWYDPDAVRKMVDAGVPQMRPRRDHEPELSLWRSADGDEVVLVSGPVVWGAVLTQAY